MPSGRPLPVVDCDVSPPGAARKFWGPTFEYGARWLRASVAATEKTVSQFAGNPTGAS